MDLPKRKKNRIVDYDYSTPGGYFITICTKDRKCILGDIVGASMARAPTVRLSQCGMIVDEAIRSISAYYPAVTVDCYVVMPNHIHLILQIHSDESGRPMVAPTISTVIQQMKGAVTKRIGNPIWQKRFHDHVIRSHEDYEMIWEYIDNNPAGWREDCFYEEGECEP